MSETKTLVSAPKLQCGCGQPMSVNPHPEAGKVPGYENVGCLHVCIPCLVKNRSEWARRAQTAENRVAELEVLLRKARDKLLEINEV